MKTSEGRARLAIFIAAVAVFAWGFGPLMVRGIGASAGTIVFWRLWMAMPVMLTAAYFTGGRVSLPLLKIVFIPGVIFGISTLVGFSSYHATSIANATLIGALQPVLMLFIAPLLFGERSSARQILLAVIALGGISTVVLGAKQSSGASLHGDALALINLGLFTTYFVRMKQVRNQGIHFHCIDRRSLLRCGRHSDAVGAGDIARSWGDSRRRLVLDRRNGPAVRAHRPRSDDVGPTSWRHHVGFAVDARWPGDLGHRGVDRVQPAAQRGANRRRDRGVGNSRSDRFGAPIQRRTGRDPVVGFRWRLIT